MRLNIRTTDLRGFLPRLGFLFKGCGIFAIEELSLRRDAVRGARDLSGAISLRYCFQIPKFTHQRRATDQSAKCRYHKTISQRFCASEVRGIQRKLQMPRQAWSKPTVTARCTSRESLRGRRYEKRNTVPQQCSLAYQKRSVCPQELYGTCAPLSDQSEMSRRRDSLEPSPQPLPSFNPPVRIVSMPHRLLRCSMRNKGLSTSRSK